MSQREASRRTPPRIDACTSGKGEVRTAGLEARAAPSRFGAEVRSRHPHRHARARTGSRSTPHPRIAAEKPPPSTLAQRADCAPPSIALERERPACSGQTSVAALGHDAHVAPHPRCLGVNPLAQRDLRRRFGRHFDSPPRTARRGKRDPGSQAGGVKTRNTAQVFGSLEPAQRAEADDRGRDVRVDPGEKRELLRAHVADVQRLLRPFLQERQALRLLRGRSDARADTKHEDEDRVA